MNNIAYDVVVTNYLTGAGIVYRVNDNKTRCAMYNVDISNKTCCCGHWEQSGVPCYHAIKLQRVLKRNFCKDDFYNFCHSDGLLLMFNNMFVEFPSYDAIVNCLISTDPFKCQIVPRIISIADNDYKLCSSSKRMASTGEKFNSRSMFTGKARKLCVTCKTWLHCRTKHPSSACLRNCKRKGIIVESTPIN